MLNSFPRGAVTASLTPLKSDLTLDSKRLIKHCHWLLEQGSAGIALLGTTGEANSFSLAERMSFLDAIATSSLPLDKIMVGTGCCAYSETVELTKHALASGMSNILMLPPFYYKQVNEEGLGNYFDLIIDQIGHDQLQIYLYHIPKMSGLGFSLSLVTSLVEKYPKVIVGIKDSSGDFGNMKEIRQALPEFRLYAGTEKHLLDVLRIGGVGCISATANVTARWISQVYTQWQTKEADALQEKVSRLRSCFEGLPFTAILKQYLAHYQNDPTWLNIRPPNSILQDAVLDKVMAGLNAEGFHP